MMAVKSLLQVIKADLVRYHGASGVKGFIKTYCRKPAFRYVFWMRVTAYFYRKKLLTALYFLSNWQYRCLQYKYGIFIPHTTKIGSGFLIGHIGNIVVNEKTTIGRNFSLSHMVTIGQKNRGKFKGCPTIGDSVYVGPGACIIGSVSIGSNVAIGANAVVVSDVHDDEVMVGIPARATSKNGSEAYVTWPAKHE